MAKGDVGSLKARFEGLNNQHNSIAKLEDLSVNETAAVSWPHGLWPGYQAHARARVCVRARNYPRIDGQEELVEIFGLFDDNSNATMEFSELLNLGKGVNPLFTTGGNPTNR